MPQSHDTRDPELPERDAPDSPWRTLSAARVYRNPWFDVTEYQVIRPDGNRGIYCVVDPGDNVTIAALDADEQIWLIREFVYPMQCYQWMLPGGAVDRDEAPLAAARRELAEETGLRATRWEPLGTYELSQGISVQRSHLFLARDLVQGEATPEPTERPTTKRWPLHAAYDACLRSDVRDAPSVLAIWRAWAAIHGSMPV